jgi:phospholipase/carboxylesterase
MAERACAKATNGSAATLVLLHGYGKYHGQLLDLWSKFDVDYSVVALRASFRIGPGAYRWFDYEDLPDGSVVIARSEERHSWEALESFLHASRYDDPDQKVFLFGHSQGGMMAFSVALLRPDLIDGCAVVNGRILPEALARLPSRPDLAGMPIFVGHGVVDPIVTVANGRRTRDLLTRMGARLVYREYHDGHDLTASVIADVVDWLQTARKAR